MARQFALIVFFWLMIGSNAYPQFTLPHTFVEGEPAVASDVNENFSTMAAAIEELQAQIEALQPKSSSEAILGTWDFISLEASGFEVNAGTGSFSSNSSGSYGSVTFNTDGTYEVTENITERDLINSNDTSTFQINCPDSCTTITKSLITPTSSVTTNTENSAGTYTISGTTVNMNDNGDITEATISADGKVLVVHWSDADSTGIAVAIKR